MVGYKPHGGMTLTVTVELPSGWSNGIHFLPENWNQANSCFDINAQTLYYLMHCFSES